MRRVFIALLVVAVLAVLVIFVAPRFIDINRYQGRIQADLEKRCNRKIELGHMDLSFAPFGFRVDRVVIGEDPRFGTGRPFAQAQSLQVTPQFWPLLHGEVVINSFAIQQPQIELVRGRDGVWNFASLGQATAAEAAGSVGGPAASAAHPPAAANPSAAGQTPAASAGGEAQAFSLAELKIENGQVAVTDLQNGAPRAVYDHIDLTVRDFAPGKPFDVSVAANLPSQAGQAAQTIGLDARVGPVNQSQAAATPVDGKLKLSQVTLASLSRFLSAEPAGTDGVATGEARIKNEAGKVSASGALSLANLKISGGEIGAASADFDCTDDLDKDVLTIRKGDLKLGGTPFSVTGEVNTKPSTPQIDLTVKTTNASIEGIAKLLAALHVSFSPGMKVEGQLTADLRAQGPAKQPVVNGTLTAQNVQISGKDLPQPIQVKSVELTLSPQEIRSNSFAAATGNTSVDAQFTLSAYATENPQIDVTLRTKDAKVEELLRMAGAYGVTALEGISGSGSANLDLHAAGAIKNASALNLSGDGSLRSASFRLPQLAKPLEVRSANMKFTRNSVVLDNLGLTLDQTNTTGSVTVQNFNAPQMQFTLNIDKLNVADVQKLFAAGPPPRASATGGWWSLLRTVYAAAAANDSLLAKATGTGKVSIGTVVNDQLTLTNLRSDVNLNHGVIRLAPLTTEVYGGLETGSITLDTTQEPMVCTLAADFKNVDANKLLSAVSTTKSNIYGPLAANVNGAYRVGPAEQIMRSLDGTIALDLRNGRIEGFSLMQELGSVGKFLKIPGPAKSYTEVTQLATKFVVKDGTARTDDLKALLDTGTISGAGTVNLVSQALDMKMTAVLSKEISQSVGGSGIGGYLNTALANRQGELVMPVLVSGTVQHPKFAPDAAQIAKLKLQNLLPTAGDTKGVQDLLQGLFGKQKKP